MCLNILIETNSKCPRNQFTCQNNRCVAESKTCDGINDCGDYSDETTLCKGKFAIRYENQSTVCVIKVTLTLVSIVIIVIFKSIADTSEQCCDEFILKWNVDKVFKYKKLMPSPVGSYRKLALLDKQRIVYYNNVSGYHLFHSGNEWVVIDN